MNLYSYPLNFWAKKKDDTEIYYPLLCHMLDVAAVTQNLWDLTLQNAARSYICQVLGLPPQKARRVISFWSGLHDIGKASPGFQSKGAEIWATLQEQGFTGPAKDPGHGVITALALRELLKNQIGTEQARNIAAAVGGYHGVFPRSISIREADDYARSQQGDIKWRQARKDLFSNMEKLCSIDHEAIACNPLPSFFIFLAGITTVADWIASNEDLFK
ncbi:MAG: CRISPR-associated endonuclease Cas3'' [Dehalococcoidia bacterium]|nr:CRISPR-associated endonuclease Cas3'' [Dehalococcoidia bacterium]